MLTVNVFDDSSKNEDLLSALQSFVDIHKCRLKSQGNFFIPLSLFSERNLGCLEVVVKFLKENASLTYAQIARLTCRDQRTIWCAYHDAQKKQKELFVSLEDTYLIPCSIFLDRTQGPLGVLVTYLKDELGLSFTQISTFLNRDYNTTWLSYRNGVSNGKT